MGWASEYCVHGGVRIHYLRSGGNKPPVVLLHGLTGNGACWTPVARALEGAFDVVMPDARGHGSSDTPAGGYGYEEQAGDVAALMEALELEAPVLVGHSMGGMTAAVVAQLLGERLRGLVLADPTFLSPQRQREVWESGVAAEHERLLRLDPDALAGEIRARHPKRTEEIIALQVEARRQTRREACEVLRPPNPDFRGLVQAIRVPMALILGDREPAVSPAVADELRGLNARLRVVQIAGAGHGLPYDQPERLAEIVMDGHAWQATCGPTACTLMPCGKRPRI